MKYELTEFGKKIAPYLLSSVEKENPKCWKIVERIIDEVIQSSNNSRKESE